VERDGWGPIKRLSFIISQHEYKEYYELFYTLDFCPSLFRQFSYVAFFHFFFKKVENLGSTFEIHLQNFPAFPKSLSTVSSPTNRLPPTDTVPSLALSLSLYENRFLLRSGFNYSRKKRHSILNPRSTLKRHLRSKGVGHGEQQQR